MFTTLQATSATTLAYPAGIVGNFTSSNVTPGSVGEPIKNSATGVAITTGVTANAASISLTPGDWDVSGACTFAPNNTTASTFMGCGTGTTSATLGALGAQLFLGVAFLTNAQAQGVVAPVQQTNVSTATTVFLVANSIFTGNTMSAIGVIFARRP